MKKTRTDGYPRDGNGRAIRNVFRHRHARVGYSRVLREKTGMLPECVMLLRRQPQHGRPLHAPRRVALTFLFCFPSREQRALYHPVPLPVRDGVRG